MNKLWIEDSHDSADCCREDFIDRGISNFDQGEYLDTMGFFETSWMIYEYHDDREYGYPNNE